MRLAVVGRSPGKLRPATVAYLPVDRGRPLGGRLCTRGRSDSISFIAGPPSVYLCASIRPPAADPSENRPSVRCACASEGVWSMFDTFRASAPRIASYGVAARSAFTIAPSTSRRMNSREPGTATANIHQSAFLRLLGQPIDDRLETLPTPPRAFAVHSGDSIIAVTLPRRAFSYPAENGVMQVVARAGEGTRSDRKPPAIPFFPTAAGAK